MKNKVLKLSKKNKANLKKKAIKEKKQVETKDLDDYIFADAYIKLQSER